MNRCGCVVKKFMMTSKPERVVAPGQGWGKPVYCPVGVRHEGGVTWIQASVRNSGTCRSDAKGDAQVAGTTRARVPMRSTGAESPVIGKNVL